MIGLSARGKINILTTTFHFDKINTQGDNKMNFVTHRDENIDIDGTHRQGYIMADYKDLLELFGRPGAGDGYPSRS